MKRLLLVPLLFLLTQISYAKEKLHYIITSDSQIHNSKGSFEASGNVVIKNTNNTFEASSNKLTYDEDSNSLRLTGNVFVNNLESESLSIQMSAGDELNINTKTGSIEFKSNNKDKVKTKLNF